MPGEIHLIGRTKGNRAGCLNGVFSLLSHKKLLPLFGIVVAHLFVMENVVFSQSNMSQSVLHRIPLSRDVKASLERRFYDQMNLGNFRFTNRIVFLTAGLFRALNMLIFIVNMEKRNSL